MVVWLRVFLALPIGLALGSFMTVAISRIPAGGSVVRPRSRCPSCGAPIRNTDNIPVVSWLLLRGRCRACGGAISPAYPLIELATAALVVGAAVRFDRVWVAVMMGALLSMMPAIAVIDARHRVIPNRLMFPSLVAFPAFVIVARLFGGGTDPIRAGLGLLLYGGGLMVVALVSGGMGMGDVKLAGLLGVAFGSLGLRYVGVAAAAAIVLGAVGSIAALARGANRKSAIPFGPYIAAGAVVAAFWGERLSSIYLRTLS